jgi:hypothetical protein
MNRVVSIGSSAPVLARVTWGTLLLAAPGLVLHALGGVDAGVGPRRLMRVLGARHLAEAVVDVRYPAVRRWAAAVDGIHACTVAGLAIVSPRWRRAATADAAVAGTFAALGILVSGRCGETKATG